MSSNLIPRNSRAPRACQFCRRRKRKCNKAVPTCSYCARYVLTLNALNLSMSYLIIWPKRFGRDCDYRRQTNAVHAFNGADLISRPVASGSPIVPFGASTGGISRPMIDLIITQEALKIFGTTENVLKTAEAYFNLTYSCLPFIGKEAFRKRASSIWTVPRGEFAMLAICMHTVLQPFSNTITGPIESPAYGVAKSMLALVESANLLTLEIIQSRILLCLYEMGHAIQPAAMLSLTAAASAGVALGICKPCARQNLHVDDHWHKSEEERRVWWTIFILDRFVKE